VQLLANLAPHFLRHSRFDCIDDPVELDHHLGDVDALVTPVGADVPSIPAMSMNQAAVIGDAIGVFSLSGIRRPQHLPLWGLTGRSNGGSPVGVIGLIATGFVLLHLSRARQVGVGGPLHVGKQYNTAECDDAENQQWPQRTNQDSK